MARKTPTTLLILAADPLSQSRLRLDEEVREIQNGLRHSRRKLNVKQQWATRTKDLRRALLDHKPTYVHFCGHGGGEAGIVLDDHPVSAEALAGLFALFSSSVKCVVLNACYSIVQATAIAQHIDAVIGMNREIGDRAAIEFAVAFYDAVGAGEPISLSFELGCNAIHLAGIQEHLTPKLLHADAEKISQATAPVPAAASSRYDWDGAPAATLLLGRESEAEQLRAWILEDRCRLVMVIGLGGIGKTDLVTCLARGGNRAAGTSGVLADGIQSHFHSVIWRSLLNAPPPHDLFTDILATVADHHRTASPSPDRQIAAIVEHLQAFRTLIILDNVESVLQPSDSAMRYRDGYEAYGYLFEQVAKLAHQSCLLLTSREKPRVVADLEGIKRPVRSLALAGIGVDETRELFAEIGFFTGGEEDWERLVTLYHGNPLALELAARHIEQVFNGDLKAFLCGGRPVFGGLQDLLDWHLDRLSAKETELMYWLAIEREPVTIATLVDDLVSPISREHIASTLQSLQRRLPLEHIFSQQFALQPVLIEHITARLVDQLGSWFTLAPAAVLEHATQKLVESVRLELRSGKLELLNGFALLKATAKENVRESQRRLIVAPILERLGHFPDDQDLASHLIQLLEDWRAERPGEPGYVAGNVINCLTHLRCDLRGQDFSRLRIWQACLDSARLQDVDFSRSEFRNTTFRHGFGAIFALCYSPDGALIAAGDGNGDVHVLRAANGEPVLRCTGHSDAITCVTFSSDGRTLASASFDNTIRLWSVAGGQCLTVLLGHKGWIYSLAFSPDGSSLASAGEDGSVLLWSTRPARLVSTLADAESFIAAVAFSPDGRYLAFGGATKVITVLRLPDLGREDLMIAHTGRIRSIAFSPDGGLLASGAEDGLVILWRLGQGTPVTSFIGHSATVRSLSFNGPGDVLASASDDHTVRLWKTVDPECIQSFDVSEDRVWAVAFSPGGRTIATGSEDCAIRIWSTETCECLMTIRGYSNKTRALAFSPEAWLLTSGSEDHAVRLWDIRSGEAIHELVGHASGVWSLASSSDHRWVASAGEDLAIRVWHLPSKSCRYVLYGHDDWVRSLGFDTTARTLASAGEDGRILLWNMVDGKCLADFRVDVSRLFAVAFCGGDRLLAGGGSDGTIRILSRENGRRIGELRGHQGWISSVVDCGDGILASSSEDGTIRLWDVASMDCVRKLEVGVKIWCCAYCSASRGIVGGTDDGVLRYWDLQGREGERRVQAHQGSIWSAAVSSDGSIVATAGDDGTIRLWRLPDLVPALGPTTLRPTRPYEGMNISGSTGLSTAQKEALRALGAIDMQPV